MNQDVRPNWPALISAGAELDAQVNKVLAFLAPAPGRAPQSLAPAAVDYVTARLKIARQQIDKMELAAKGGA